MFVPRKLDQIEKMIRDGVQENLHLDYKASAALSRNKASEICKDISAFANSDGGVLIYGVEEEGHLPVRIDDGVATSEIAREWLEQVINANIAPRLDNLEIVQVPRFEVATPCLWSRFQRAFVVHTKSDIPKNITSVITFIRRRWRTTRFRMFGRVRGRRGRLSISIPLFIIGA